MKNIFLKILFWILFIICLVFFIIGWVFVLTSFSTRNPDGQKYLFMMGVPILFIFGMLLFIIRKKLF